MSARDSGERPSALYHGVFAVAVTPFNADFSLDREGLRANIEFLSTSTADVIVLLGSEGEFYALTDRERRDVVEIATETCAGRRPLIVGVSHPSSIEAEQLVLHARRNGADAVMATGPYYANMDGSSVINHFRTIAAGGLPVFIYNSPSRVGYTLRVDQLVAIAIDEPNVWGVKQAAPDMADLAELITWSDGRAFQVVGGSETVFWPAACLGVAGNTATAASAIPDTFHDLWRHAVTGDMAEGRRIFARLQPLRRAYVIAGGQAAVVKRLLEMVGLAGGPPRPPANALPPAVDRLLEEVLSIAVRA